jgi:hypothetical protein
LDWLPKYNLEDGISDLIAGITVGLTIIPQGIAYALVANLPAQVRHFSFYRVCQIRPHRIKLFFLVNFDPFGGWSWVWLTKMGLYPK